jgi:hypothetical protein
MFNKTGNSFSSPMICLKTIQGKIREERREEKKEEKRRKKGKQL